ncbi:hypothetical protein BJ944DRAFT_272075 [Cunninghamella echinulata]|nr:hypothetical protein BJ944DRAFT_272075 [Cunninghamella echinulata]
MKNNNNNINISARSNLFCFLYFCLVSSVIDNYNITEYTKKEITRNLFYFFLFFFLFFFFSHVFLLLLLF